MVASCVLGIAGVVVWRHVHDRPPFGPDELDLTGTLELVSYDRAQQALGSGVNAPVAYPGDQLVLGRVAWSPPPAPLDGGWFTIVLIDKPANLIPGSFAVASPAQASVGIGSDGTLRDVADRFPWLAAVAPRRVGSGWAAAGSVIYARAGQASPVTFVTSFAATKLPQPLELPVATGPVAIPDLLLALVYIGPDGQIYWARRLAG
jgi:hypothetical protein